MPWTTEQIFLTVKAYPNISRTYAEACCMAGITRAGEWIRLYPVYFRDLEDDQRFTKYTWIQANVQRSKDFRVGSYSVDSSSIKPLARVATAKGWSARNSIVMPLVRPAAVVFREDRPYGQESLGLIKVKQILRLDIEEARDEDYQKQLANLNRATAQISLLPAKDLTPLEIIPWGFRYHYLDDAGFQRHLKIVDWEICQLYRKVKHKPNWQDLIRQKYVNEFAQKDLHLFVGTVRAHPQNWLAIGVYYPPMQAPGADIVVQPGLDLA